MNQKLLSKALLFFCFLQMNERSSAADGAYIIFINQTPLNLSFGTSDVDYCWKNNIKDVNGTISPYGRSGTIYFERSRNMINLCVDGNTTCKFKVEEPGHSDIHFANVYIESQHKGGFRQIGNYINGLVANAIINNQGKQAVIEVYISLPMNYSTWISDKNIGSKRINELNIPGTHDAGTAASCTFSSIVLCNYGRCQDMGIMEQLEHGIRFLDVRLEKAGDRLRFSHGSVSYDSYFDDALRECKTFLARNPGEFIIMSVKSEGANFSDDFWEKKYNNDAIFYRGCDIPTVDQAKGKIILIRRFGGDDNMTGFKTDFNSKNGDNSKNAGKRTSKIYNCSNGALFTYSFQDFYDTKLDNADEKKKAIEDFIEYKKNNPSFLCINFTSFTAKNGVGLPFPRKGADVINTWLGKLIETKNLKQMGIFVMDFPPQPLINSIINSN